MLSTKLLKRKDIGGLSSYYSGGADDYYRKEGQVNAWYGRGAQALGLSGEVESRRFRELLAGDIAPGPGARRSTRRDSNNRVGIDETLNAPKSVSLQILIGGDTRLLDAHDRAVERALDALEKRADARIKVRGKSRVENTQNLIVARFRHETARGTDAHRPEPHLHTHAVLLNLTQRQDGKWVALTNERIIKSTREIGALYQAELAHEVQALGYEIRSNPDGTFDLAHISRAQIAAFSHRSEDIREELRNQGLDRDTATTGQKQSAVMMSRQRKEPVNREALQADWQRRAAELGIDFTRPELPPPSAENSRNAPDYTATRAAAARTGVEYAIRHLTERLAIVTHPDLVQKAAGHVLGRAGPEQIETEIERRIVTGALIREAPRYRLADDRADAPTRTREEWGDWIGENFGLDAETAAQRVNRGIEGGGLVATASRYTTPLAVRREQSILSIEVAGRGQVPPVLSAEAVRSRLASDGLNAGQQQGATLILTTEDRIIGIQGGAGTGKSHMLQAVVREMEAAGYRAHPIASYGSQSKALRELGVESQTLAAFLRRQNKGLDQNSVIILDEAGVVPVRLMERILREEEKAGARVVLVGDTRQTKAIEAGDPFRQLQRAGMATAHLDEIQRQRDPQLKAAVALAAGGNTAAALAKVRQVREIPDASARWAAIAADYLALAPSERASTLIVSATNEARREINTRIRAGLGLAGTGEEYDTLRRRDTTREQRRHSQYYHVGDMIQPERDNGAGLARGELYRVTETGPGNRLTVEGKNGQQVEFSPYNVWHLSVYEPSRAELAPGDLVRITRNDAARDLANGDRFTVENVSRGTIALRNGERTVTLPADGPLHIDYAYASTVHSAQGLTADRVLIDADSRSRLTEDSTFYVALSRPRHEARIYTDDAARLPPAVARQTVKDAAMDLQRERERERGRDGAGFGG